MSYRAPDLDAGQRAALPQPILDARPDWLELYWRSWAIAFNKVRYPNARSGLVPFVDEGFSENIFQWDTCFMLTFLRYATRAMPVYGTLDNFYRKQHEDGFICREINEITGDDFWSKDHPSGVNPPLFADAEWQLYEVTGDQKRLVEVLPHLIRYYRWLQRHRRHEDGIGYWTTSLASGMDNTPRPFDQGGDDVHKDYGYVWLCMTAQQVLAAHRISYIAAAIGEVSSAALFRGEADELGAYVDAHLWHESLGLYVDGRPDGQLSDVKTPATCWPLLSGRCPQNRADRIAENLLDPATFWRPHAIPGVSADHAAYHPRGNYWQGSVWPPMVQLAVRAMDATGHLDTAQRIAENHLDNLSTVFHETGTLWENYMPETAAPGNISRPEFAGWTACGPIGALIEVIIGLVPDAPADSLTWRLTREDRHGIRNLPLGQKTISLWYEPVVNRIVVEAERSFTLRIQRDGQEQTFTLSPGSHQLDV